MTTLLSPEEYWKQVEATGMAHEWGPKTLVMGSYRDGLRAAVLGIPTDVNTVRWATRVHELEHAITSFLNEYAKKQQPHGGIGEEPIDGDTIAFHARRILGKYALSP